MNNYKDIYGVDDLIYEILNADYVNQESKINLIASENYASKAILCAQSSHMTNKYAEGYPGNRYYGGCSTADAIEKIAIERATNLFQCTYANVQPHSGSQANQAVFMALLAPKDTILSMSLTHGGHLTHGHKVNFTGHIYNIVNYGVKPENYDIDYDMVEKLAKEYKPKIIIAGFSSFSGILDWQKFKDIANLVGAYLLADIAHVSGLIAAGIYPNPVKIADVVTTTTHKTLRGPRGGLILSNSEEIAKKIDKAVFPGIQGGPLMHVITAKAIAFKEASTEEFKTYQNQILKNTRILGSCLLKRNIALVSKDLHNHMLMVDLQDLPITGIQLEKALEECNIICNRNTRPYDKRSPVVTSAIRLGTAAITTRGFQKEEVEQIANWIADVIQDINNQEKRAHIRSLVHSLCEKFPIYK